MKRGKGVLGGMGVDTHVTFFNRVFVRVFGYRGFGVSRRGWRGFGFISAAGRTTTEEREGFGQDILRGHSSNSSRSVVGDDGTGASATGSEAAETPVPVLEPSLPLLT